MTLHATDGMTIDSVRKSHHLCCNSYAPKAVGFTDLNDLRYCVTDDGLNIFIAIRGADNLDNWLRSLQIIPSRTPRGHMGHGGFVKAFRQLLPHIMIKLRQFPRLPVICTGHSLGGAIAVLLAEQFNCEVVTFGAPAVYHKGWGIPELAHSRIVRDDDPVPLLPDCRFQHDAPAIVVRDADRALWEVGDHKIDTYLPKELP